MLVQAVIRSLRYSYSTSGEEVPGVRHVRVTVSDGVFSDSVTLMVTVVVLNNNPPVVVFSGQSSTLFVEGMTQPLPIGMIVQLQ